MDSDFLFNYWAYRHPDMSDDDFARELEISFAVGEKIQKLQQGIVQGNLSLGEIEELADCLAQNQVEPYNYASCIMDNWEFVITNKIFVEF